VLLPAAKELDGRSFQTRQLSLCRPGVGQLQKQSPQMSERQSPAGAVRRWSSVPRDRAVQNRIQAEIETKAQTARGTRKTGRTT